MLTIAYPWPADFLADVPFDCEIDPKLVRMDEVLDDPKLVLAVTNDLARSAPQSLWNGLCWLHRTSVLISASVCWAADPDRNIMSRNRTLAPADE